MVYFLIGIVIIFLDQVTKKYFEQYYKQGEYREVVKGRVYLTNIRNTGAAYGFLENKPKFLKILTVFVFICSGIFYFFLFKEDKRKVLKYSMAFVFGGGIANFLDRVRKKYVTDFIFIKFKNAPIFNIADIFVFLGSLLLFLFSFLGKEKS